MRLVAEVAASESEQSSSYVAFDNDLTGGGKLQVLKNLVGCHSRVLTFSWLHN